MHGGMLSHFGVSVGGACHLMRLLHTVSAWQVHLTLGRPVSIPSWVVLSQGSQDLWSPMWYGDLWSPSFSSALPCPVSPSLPLLSVCLPCPVSPSPTDVCLGAGDVAAQWEGHAHLPQPPLPAGANGTDCGSGRGTRWREGSEKEWMT